MVPLINSKRNSAALRFGLAILVMVCAYVSQGYQEPSVRTSSAEATALVKPSSIPETAGSAVGVEATIPLNVTEWTQLAHDPQRTGYVPIEVPGPWQFKWIWNGPVGGGDAGPASDHLALPKGIQPIVGDGRLYVGHNDGRVRAISEATGTQVWSSFIGGEVLNTGAYDPETKSVYFGSTNGRLYRLRASDGQILNEFNAGGEIVMAPLLTGDTVYIGSTNGTFYALNKTTLTQRWSYNAGASLLASPAYSANHGGLVIILSEDKFAHAIQVSDGSRRWRVAVNADKDPLRGNTSFADTYPVVSEINDAVIVRSYLDWEKMWSPVGGAPSTVEQIRSYLAANPTLQSFFVLNLDNGAQRFVAPVMVGAIGNGGDFQSVPPQAVVKNLADGTEMAYLLWRTRQACRPASCDGREDTTLGEMDLGTGNIRFVQDYKNGGTIRLPTDEQSPLSMAGNTLFYAHWMTLGSVRITDRSPDLGSSYSNPIRTEELTPVLNTLASGSCSNRDSSRHYCPQDMYAPGDNYRNDPGFYVYYYNRAVYDQYWRAPVRSAVISNGTIYWKTVDGAIIALQAAVDPTGSRKTASPAAAGENETITFAITVAGTGKLTTVTDQLPTPLTYLSTTTTCPGTVGYSDTTRQVTYSGAPSAGSSCVIEISTRVNTDQRMVVTNLATVDNGLVSPYEVSALVILNGLDVYLPLIMKAVPLSSAAGK